MKSVLTITAVLIITALLLSANKFLTHIELTLNSNSFINAILKYQLYALIIAVIVVFTTLKISPGSKTILSVGNLPVIAEKERRLGINGKTSWRSNGVQLLFFISIATAIFMFLAVKYTNSLGNFKWLLSLSSY